MNVTDAESAALGAFERWSNYLLITTVAAVGWVSSNGATFSTTLYKAVTLWLLGASTIFGIFTLALVPLIAARKDQEQSMYDFLSEFLVFGKLHRLRLATMCRTQHVLFIAGVMAYCIGTVSLNWADATIAGGVVLVALIIGLLSARRGKSP